MPPSLPPVTRRETLLVILATLLASCGERRLATAYGYGGPSLADRDLQDYGECGYGGTECP